MLTALVGILWGEEGTGRTADLVAQEYKIAVRFQGGADAGYTLKTDTESFALNQLPAGILRGGVVSVLGAGTAVDLELLWKEISSLRKKGISIKPDRLKISGKATIVFPYHVLEECLYEETFSNKKPPAMRHGIAYAYADKATQTAMKAEELIDIVSAEKRLREMLKWKNSRFSSYGKQIDVEKTVEWLKRYAEKFSPYICDTQAYLLQAANESENMLFEARSGALSDVDFGIYPYTSPFSTLAAYAGVGAGTHSCNVEKVVGVVKAYASYCGRGDFVSELFAKEANLLRKAGGEAARRVGAFDMVAAKRGIALQGASELALNRLDALSSLEAIPVCVAYEREGERLEEFPESLSGCKPIFEYFDSWKQDISACRHVGDLPKEAIYYLKFLESNLNIPLKYIFVGERRQDVILAD